MRDALSLLDQLSSSTKEITIENILSNYGSISLVFIKKLFQNVLDNNINDLLIQFEELKNSSSDYKIFIKKFIHELVQYAIKLKTEYHSSRLSYDQIKDLVFGLNECMNRVNININPYTLIELEILNYVDNHSEKKLEKQTNLENQETQKEIKEESHQLEINPSLKEEESFSNFTDEEVSNQMENLKRIRINNCFCNAQKQVLNKLKESWQDISISPIPDDIISLLVDSKIVAASNSYAVISTGLESTAMLINNRIYEIGEYLSEFFDQELLFVALSEEEWQKEKLEYVNKIKSGFKYQIMEEPIVKSQSLDSTKDTSMEKIAQELFDHDKIEIM